MSGHSQWRNIRERKSRVDEIKGKLFTKVAREIVMAVRQGGANPDSNFRLRLTLLKARDINMPKENIERAVQRGSGQGAEERMEEVMYEGYGPGGVAVLMEITTDNRHRTAAELRNIFTRFGGALGESGCVSWMFEKKGLLLFDDLHGKEEELFSAALEAGALDLRQDGKTFEVYTSPQSFETVKQQLEKSDFNPSSAEITFIPQSTVTVSAGTAKQLVKLLNTLEEHEDVQKVHSNVEMDENLLQEFTS